MTDHPGGLRQQWNTLAHDRREFDRSLACHRADPYLAVLLADIGEFGDLIKVDQRRGAGQMEVEQRHETLTAG
jgi:hypothetical protein